ncbi:T6SS effector BTH_I2691 family protein [Pragia fontium]|uniref:T6SS effector BTH_I2691 family protein n=1 Tax=Pragia fontium TaxID=82985 RepID=UPI00064B7FE2|nr:T6SS effector BTH_I2691 family protein [Pragia fontium]AKJ42105.1 hypothetical protein QQ39_08385 [Pragia fontium]
MSGNQTDNEPTLNDVISSVKNSVNNIKSNISGPEASCSACKKDGDLFLLPLRYGVIGRQDGIPELPLIGTSANKVGTIAIQTAHYTIQMMRKGYLYVLEERSEGMRWRGFTVSQEGCLYESEPEKLPETPPNFGCDVTTHGVMASYINVQNSAELNALYMMFCPDKMTNQRLDFYQNDGKNELQKITQAQLASAQGGAAENELDVIKPESLTEHVLEFNIAQKALARPPKAPYLSPDIGKMVVNALADKVVQHLNDESFNRPYSDQLYGVPKLCQTAVRYTKLISGLEERKGLAIVLNDAIGITQSLVNWRNAGVQDELKPWMEKKDKQGISNERRLMVYQKIDEIKEKFGDIKIAALLSKRVAEKVERKKVYFTGGGTAYDPQINMPEQQWFALLDTLESEEKPALEAQYTEEKIESDKAEFQKKYWDKIESGLKAFKQQFDLKCKTVEANAENRAQDAAKWLSHLKLADALKCYDPCDMSSGILFNAQTGLCIIGLETSEACSQIIDRWWSEAAMSERNLCWRSYMYNNEKALEKARELAALGQQQEPLKLPYTSSQLDAFEYLHDFLGKALEHADKLADNQRVAAERSVGILAWIGAGMRYTLKANLPNALDSKISYILNGIAQRGVNKIAFDLKLEDIGKRAAGRARASSTAVKGNVSAVGTAEYEMGKHGKFYKIVHARNKVLIQALLLFMKGKEAQDTGDRRKYLEFVSAGIAVAAVGIELVASSVEIMVERTGPSEAALARGQKNGNITYRSTATFHSQLKVWAGAFSMVAGVMLVSYDVADAIKANKKGESTLAIAYFGRATAIALLTAGEIMNSLVAGQLYFVYLAKYSKSRFFSMVGRFGVGISEHLAKALAGEIATGLILRGCVALMRFVPILGWVVLAASVLFMIFGPDELEDWLDDCCFSQELENQSNIKDTAEELGRLEEAVKGVVA